MHPPSDAIFFDVIYKGPCTLQRGKQFSHTQLHINSPDFCIVYRRNGRTMSEWRKQMNWNRVSAVLAFVTAAVLLEPGSANAQRPMAAKVKVTTLESYSGSTRLQKPERIAVYDFVVNPDDIQVDRSQSIRPRHIIAGDENAPAIARKAQGTYSKELMAKLAKTGIPVQHAEAGSQPLPNSLVVEGSFVSLKQGDKTERVALGFGTGTADIQTQVNVHLNTSGEPVLVSRFSTDTDPAKSVGSVVPVVAGLNPAAVAAKSTVGDRKKSLNSYTSKSADAAAKEITKLMGEQGWIEVNDHGEVTK